MQFATIRKYAKAPDSYRLNILLSKFIRHRNAVDIINGILKHSKNDLDVFNKVNKFTRKKTDKDESEYVYGKSRFHAKIFVQFVKNNIDTKINTYLDIGCGNCVITKFIGNNLDLDDKNIYGTDIDVWDEPTWTHMRPSTINFKVRKDHEIPFNKKFDLISYIMVLHHIENIDETLKNTNKALNKNGYILIKEHDLFDDIDKMLTDIEHSLYMISKPKLDTYLKDYRAYYYNWLEWNIIMKYYGFVYVTGMPFYSSVKGTQGPTRHFYALYKKIV